MIRVKSIIDVITNSSSEVFLLQGKPDTTIEKLRTELANIWATLDHDACSGMGGVLDIYDSEHWAVDDYWDPDYEGYEGLADYPGLFIVELDHAMSETVKWMIENYRVLGTEDTCPSYDETGRVIDPWGGDRKVGRGINAFDYVEYYKRSQRLVEASHDPEKANEEVEKYAEKMGLTTKEAQPEWWDEVFEAEEFLAEYENYKLPIIDYDKN